MQIHGARLHARTYFSLLLVISHNAQHWIDACECCLSSCSVNRLAFAAVKWYEIVFPMMQLSIC